MYSRSILISVILQREGVGKFKVPVEDVVEGFFCILEPALLFFLALQNISCLIDVKRGAIICAHIEPIECQSKYFNSTLLEEVLLLCIIEVQNYILYGSQLLIELLLLSKDYNTISTYPSIYTKVILSILFAYSTHS